ncbi:cation:proton antiporter [Microlunatus endophyticus]|nr:sodium:proton antiporter [Microlunatus endophyticus]
MNGIELLLVVIAAIGVTAFAQRRGLQAPLVLVVLGLAVSFIPGLPRLEIEPEIILGVVLPPLLYSTAVEFSFINFMRNLWPILGLGIGLVLITAFAVGLVANRLTPQLTAPAALVLGAVVAPSDAVTAVAIGRRLGLPKRVMTILTGESLINDAAALTLFTIAAVQVTGQGAFISQPVVFFGYGVVVGLIVGRVLALIVQKLQQRLDSPGLETVLGLVLPFSCYLAAEQLHASGVIAVVTAGFAIGHNRARSGYAARIQETQVWRSLDVLLEAFVFAYMGMQMKFVFQEVTGAGHSLPRVLVAALVSLLVVLAVRPACVLVNHLRLVGTDRLRQAGQRRRPDRDAERQQRREAIMRRRIDEYNRQHPDHPRDIPSGGPERQPSLLPLKHDIVISWTGMRGVVTLAAAAGIPATAALGAPFPGRAEIQLIAFVIAVGTLLIQGTTLPPLIRKLDIRSEDDAAYEAEQRKHAAEITQKATTEVITKAMTKIDNYRTGDSGDLDPEALAALSQQLQRFQANREALQAETEEAERADADQQRADRWRAVSRIRLEMLTAQRKALTAERDAFRLDDDTYREMLEQLDYDEAAISARMDSRL